MRILVISSVYPRSEEDTEVPWMRESLRRLRLRGHQLEVLAPAWKGLRSHLIDGIVVHRFRYAPAGLEILTGEEGAPSRIANRPWLQLLAVPYLLFGALACIRLAKRGHADVLHVHWPFPHGPMVMPAHFLLGVPLLPNFHGAELLMSERKRWIRPLLRWILRHSRLAVANSSFTRAKVKALKPLPVSVVPYGTTLRLVSSTPRLCPEGARFRALFVGRHIERKGIGYLIQAFALLPSEQFELVIVGEGDITPGLRDLAEGIPGARIRFTGRIPTEQLEEEYRCAHAFVLPAIVDRRGDTEGLGVVLVEAAEAGLPIIASAVGGIPDVVEDGVTGLAVLPQNPESIATALRRLQGDSELCHRLILGAQERVRKLFDWDVVAQSLEVALDQATQGRGAGDRT